MGYALHPFSPMHGTFVLPLRSGSTRPYGFGEIFIEFPLVFKWTNAVVWHPDVSNRSADQGAYSVLTAWAFPLSVIFR